MIKKLICLSAFVATIFPLALNAQVLDKGNIKALFVKGEVTLTDQDTGSVSPLNRGDIFRDGTTITTGKDSTAVVILSNGSSVRVGPESVLEVKEFEQEAFDPSLGSYLTLTEDPSISRTDLLLKSGTIAGETKHLSSSSEYVVSTPIGSAGIRGTKFGVTVATTTNAAGAVVYVVTVSNAEGSVSFETPATSGDVQAGEEINFSGEVAEDGTVTINEVQPPEAISADLVNAINELSNQTAGEGAPEAPAPVVPPTGDTSDPTLEVSPAGN